MINLFKKIYEIAAYPVSDDMAFMILTPMLVVVAVGVLYRSVTIIKNK